MRAWQAHLVALGGISFVILFGLLGIQESVGGVYEKQPRTSAAVGELVVSAEVGQTFVAEYAGLSRVEILLATYARRNTGTLVFHLRDAEDAAEDLVTLTIGVAKVEDNAYHTFEFPPISDSADRTFYFYLEAPKAKPGNAITVWGATEDAYPDGEAVLEGLEGHNVHDLTFRLGYDLPMKVKVDIFLERLVANKPSLWGDKWLYISLVVAYLSLLYALFIWAMRSGFSERDEETC